MTGRPSIHLRNAAPAAAGWLASAAGRTYAAAPPAGSAGPDPALAAREVFQDQDFWWKRVETPTVSTSWITAILRAVGDFLGRILSEIGQWLARLLRSLFRMLGGSAEAGTLIVWVVVALLLAWALWKILPALIRWLGAGPPDSQQGRTRWQALPEPVDLLEEAGHAFKWGKYAEAVRLALLALIARLEKEGLLRYDTSRTNREYQRELRDRAELAASFGRLARIYERVWYGGSPAGREEAEQALGLCRTMIAGEDLAPE